MGGDPGRDGPRARAGSDRTGPVRGPVDRSDAVRGRPRPRARARAGSVPGRDGGHARSPSTGTEPGAPAPTEAAPPGDAREDTREDAREDDGRPKRFAYPPQLVVVDGGQPQVAAAKRALDELGIDDVAVCGLAKRLEEVWLPDDDDPVVLPRSSEGLYLLQRIRDEAHRFAITYQRAKRAKRIRSSPLDDVAGLGGTRKQALIKHFGSVKNLRQATIDEICEVPGIGRRTAESVAVASPRPPRPHRP